MHRKRKNPTQYESLDISVNWQLHHQEPLLVIAQPKTEYQDLQITEGRIHPVASRAYLARLKGVIEFTRRQKAQFCLFPEYSWPVKEFSAAVSGLAEHHEEERCYVMPLEHLTVARYRDLLKDLNKRWFIPKDAYEAEMGELSQADKSPGIINVAFTILQSALKKPKLIIIPQRKLAPAALEQRPELPWQFIGGRFIYIIKAKVRAAHDDQRLFWFATLVCFDVLHRGEDIPEERPRDPIARKPMSLLFVPECNPQPLHDLYLKGEIAMFQAPLWAQYHPVMAFANIAAGSQLALPPEMRASWGFSRLVGDLGEKIEGTGGFRVYRGFIGRDTPTSLADLDEGDKAVKRLADHKVRSVIIRPEAAVVTVKLPNVLTGPSKDVAVGRVNTEVRVHRPISEDQTQWRRILPPPPFKAPALGIPDQLRSMQLKAVKQLQDELIERMHKHLEPIYVSGFPGSGKSALVASVLEQHVLHDRIVWIDLADVPPRENALIDALLLKLLDGRRRDKRRGTRSNLDELRQELRRQSTVIVLDGPEEWRGQALPESILQLRGWKTLIIVITQLTTHPPEADGSSDGGEEPHLDTQTRTELLVEALPDDEFRQLITEHAGTTPPPEFMSVLMRATNRAPLAAVWGGELLRNASEYSHSLTERLTDAQRRPALETIFGWCLDMLVDEQAKVILGVLCQLPGPVSVPDVGLILAVDVSDVMTPLQSLLTLQFIQSRVQGKTVLYRAHPFVRHLWRHAPQDYKEDLEASWGRAIEWAIDVSEEYGGDHNFDDIRNLAKRWPNISDILYRLAQEESRYLRDQFLTIWRNCDEFLWIDGRWRERLDLATIAEEFTRDIDAGEVRAHALYDSMAKTKWHLTRETSPADEWIEEAAAIANDLKDDVLRASVVWYRSRMLLHCGKPDQALAAAEEAVALAGKIRNADEKAYMTALTLNARGNARRARNQKREARHDYNEAESRLRSLEDSGKKRELAAILTRNQGRLDAAEGGAERALEKFEEAMTELRMLNSPIQAAECAIYHAEALMDVGDVDDADRELDWAESVVAHLGSQVLNHTIREARRKLEMLTPPL